MKRGQKNKETGIFSDFFMTRKGVKNYSKERPHLTKKDCSVITPDLSDCNNNYSFLLSRYSLYIIITKIKKNNNSLEL
jgi:hypothetical protein